MKFFNNNAAIANINIAEIRNFIKNALIDGPDYLNINSYAANASTPEEALAALDAATRNADSMSIRNIYGQETEIRLVYSDDFGSAVGSPAFVLPIYDSIMLIIISEGLGILNDKEKLAIVGHEIGHVYYGHFTEARKWHEKVTSREALEEAGFTLEQVSTADRFFNNEAQADDIGVMLGGRVAMIKGLAILSTGIAGDGLLEIRERIRRLAHRKYTPIEVGEDMRVAIKWLAILGIEEYNRRQAACQAVYSELYEARCIGAVCAGDTDGVVRINKEFSAHCRRILSGACAV